VQNYRFHETAGPTEYRVEVEINGEVQQFQGTIAGKGETGTASDLTILEFDYDPNQRKPEDPQLLASGPYASYSDEVILRQWQGVLPAAHILKIEDPKAIVDVMLGVMAIVGLPPFGVFTSEFLILTATIKDAPATAPFLLLGLAVAFAALLRRVQPMVSGEPPPWQLPLTAAHVPVVLHLVLVLAVGLYLPPFLSDWFQTAVVLLK
jgi:hypothetical protein